MSYKCELCMHEDECAEMGEQIAYCKAFEQRNHKKSIYKGIEIRQQSYNQSAFLSGGESYPDEETFEQSQIIHISSSNPMIFFESVLMEVEIPFFEVPNYKDLKCPNCQGNTTSTGKENELKCYNCDLTFNYKIDRKEE